MPVVKVGRKDVAVEDAVTAIGEQLGGRFTVTKKDGKENALRVETSALVYVNVHLVPAEGGTSFHVHGGGLSIGRLLNEMGVARKVAQAIGGAPGLGVATGPLPPGGGVAGAGRCSSGEGDEAVGTRPPSVAPTSIRVRGMRAAQASIRRRRSIPGGRAPRWGVPQPTR